MASPPRLSSLFLRPHPGRRLLRSADDGGTAHGWHRMPDLDDAGGDPRRPDAVRCHDTAHRSYDKRLYVLRFWDSVSRIAVRADEVSRRVRRQVQPGSVFLGLDGSRGHAVLGPARAAASRRRAESARSRDARRLLARGQQLRASGRAAVPFAHPAFYSYAYPEPAGFAEAKVAPDAAFYSKDLREYLLPYDTVRLSPTPDETLLAFLQATYEAAANLGGWDRRGLERQAAHAPSR